MKIICTQENLNKGIKITERIISHNTTLPILNNLLLETDGSRLKISSTNLELGITCWIRAKVDKPGKITIPAQILSNFVSSLPKEKIIIKLTKKNNLNLTCSNYKVDIKGLPAKDFPIIPLIKQDEAMVLNIPSFWRALSQVSCAMSTSQSRPEIASVLLSAKEKQLKIVATDSYRLAEKKIDLPQKINQEIKVIIPQQTVAELIRVLQEKEGEVKVLLEENQIMFELSNINFISRLVEGKFPDYEQIIPDKLKTKAIFDVDQISKAVKVASLFSSQDNEIKFDFKNTTTLEINAQSEEVGQNTAKIKGEIKGTNKSISFNYKYIEDGLHNIFTDKVCIRINNDKTPAILKPYTPKGRRAKDKDYLYLIMPIKST